ncbi:unnamed protein product [Mytilus coruscus]|uniref:ABC transmembrane type-1 domain-containing protein n=1 Tax=Mytilus coruscus TaxID=42192 RepID=A0A6J8EKM3_MYTCO|nr:unnamed protein product [Mytilus coruscus]
MNGPEWHLIVIGIIVSILAGGFQPMLAIILSEFLKVFTIQDDDEAKFTSATLVGIIMAVAVGSATCKLIVSLTFCIAGGNLTTRLRKLAFKSIVWQVGEKIKKDQESMIRVHEPIRSIKDVLTTWKMTSNAEMDIQNFLEVTRGKRMNIIQNCGLKGVKINVVLHCTFVKINPTGKEDDENEGHFNSGNRTITEATDLIETFKEMDQKIGEKIAEWTSEKSGWTLKEIVKLQLNINQHTPLSGSQYVALPKWIKEKNAVINVQNRDDKCFKWAILAAVHHEEEDQKHTHRWTQYCRWNNELNLKGLEFPDLRFLDSFKIMSKSLEELAKVTPKEKLKNMQKVFGDLPLDPELYKVNPSTSENNRVIQLREVIDKRKMEYIVSHPDNFELGSRCINGV